MAAKLNTVTLSNGTEMPLVGLGTWKSKAGEVEKAVKHAIDVGYRHIDCAFAYGNEPEVGTAIREKLSEGKVQRKDIFVISKLWNTRHAAEDVKHSVQESLDNLGLSYLDLYLMHWPHAFKSGKEVFPKDEQGNVIYADIDPLSTWKALEACVDEGLIKSLGMSNFNSEQIQRILDGSRIKPVNLQVEVHPYFNNDKLVKFCQDRGIVVTAYSPLGSADRPGIKPDDPLVIDEPKLKAIAEKYKKSPAQVVLRWLLQRNIAIIPKSVTPSRIEENLQVTDFELSSQDMTEISSFDKGHRMVAPFVEVDGKRVYRDRHAPHFPFLIEY